MQADPPMQLPIGVTDYLSCSAKLLDLTWGAAMLALLRIHQIHHWRHAGSCFKKNGRVPGTCCCRFLFPKLLTDKVAHSLAWGFFFSS
jgi:hypothetical protein